jgi:hypothetical protein
VLLNQTANRKTLPVTIITDPSIQTTAEYLYWKQKNATGDSDRYFVPERPAVCPECRSEKSFWVKGYYFRWFVDREIEDTLPVPRYICRKCRLVVSVLFAFLVPYRQFTQELIAEGAEKYLLTETSYRQAAGSIAGDNSEAQRPHHCQVFKWVQVVGSLAAWKLNVLLQRYCVKAGKTHALNGLHDRVCLNAQRSRTLSKFWKLNSGARLLALAEICFDRDCRFLSSLQSHFASAVQSPISILTGRGIRLISPQSSQHPLF